MLLRIGALEKGTNHGRTERGRFASGCKRAQGKGRRGEKNLSVLEVSVVGVLERFRADMERFRTDMERCHTEVERLRTDIAKQGEENAKRANARDWRLIIFMFVLVSIATSIILAVLGT